MSAKLLKNKEIILENHPKKIVETHKKKDESLVKLPKNKNLCQTR